MTPKNQDRVGVTCFLVALAIVMGFFGFICCVMGDRCPNPKDTLLISNGYSIPLCVTAISCDGENGRGKQYQIVTVPAHQKLTREVAASRTYEFEFRSRGKRFAKFSATDDELRLNDNSWNLHVTVGPDGYFSGNRRIYPAEEEDDTSNSTSPVEWGDIWQFVTPLGLCAYLALVHGIPDRRSAPEGISWHRLRASGRRTGSQYGVLILLTLGMGFVFFAAYSVFTYPKLASGVRVVYALGLIALWHFMRLGWHRFRAALLPRYSGSNGTP